jgi:hypothetical protein
MAFLLAVGIFGCLPFFWPPSIISRIGFLHILNDRVPNVSYRQNSFVFQAGISYAF